MATPSVATSAATKSKRKRKVLTIDDKVAVIKQLETCTAAVIAEQLGVGKSTISDIKKNRVEILQFKQRMSDLGMNKKAKVMKVGEDSLHDSAVYLWFKQKRSEGTPISGPILCEKAVQLYKKMYGEDAKFSGSKGWQWRFCKRHGIRNLSLQGEKLSADPDASKHFISTFNDYIEEKHLTLHQIFNCDETGLNFRLLPNKTLATHFEKSADGRKKSKDRVTINACANASGSIKLPLQLIGKSKVPRCFKKVKMDLLPVQYRGQKNAWMTTEIFQSWFHETFVPTVRKELSALGLEQKAVLVLDNCSAHPNAEDLVSDDGKISALYLPPNVTALIQPMDQGVLETLKRLYKKKLLRRLVIEEENGTGIIAFLKTVNMKVVVDMISESWNEIKATTLRKSWQKIISSQPQAPSSEESIEENHSDRVDPGELDQEINISEFISDFQELGFNMDQDELDGWLSSDSNDPGFQLMTEDEICDHVMSEAASAGADEEKDEDEDEEEHYVCPISNSAAAHMLDQCLTWLEDQPEADSYNISTLKGLRALAVRKRGQSLRQKTLTDMFGAQE